MSQQINLYEARLRPSQEWLTGRRVAVLALVLLVMLAGGTVFARLSAERAEKDLAAWKSEVLAEQEKLAALNKSFAERRLPAALQSELETTRAMLATRKDVVALIDSGRLGNSSGFSEIMYGFARQASGDLWLSGFSVSMGGQEIEIRGRLFDSGKLPGYVQRLSREPVFQGRRFAALDMQSIDADGSRSGSSDSVPAAPAGAVPVARLPRHVEFVLRSENAGDATKATGDKK